MLNIQKITDRYNLLKINENITAVKCRMFAYNLEKYNNDIKPDINTITNLVYKNNGKVFGGYVRDFLVPKFEYQDYYKNFNINKLCKNLNSIICSYSEPFFDCNDLDIWVSRKRDKKRFLNQLKLLYSITDITDHKKDDIYPISGNKYLIENPKMKFTFDILVSSVFPVNDFSVNLLSFDGKKLKVEEILTHYSKLSIEYMNYTIYYKVNVNNIYCYTRPLEFTLEDILDQIKNKQMVLLYDYCYITPFLDKHMINECEAVKCSRYKKFTENKKYKVITFISKE